MKVLEQDKPYDDAALLANNMAAITRELEQTYRRFLVRAISEEFLISEIKRILNSNYDTTPIERILEELELRYELREHLSRMIETSGWVIFNTNQLVLDENHRINVGETLRKYYQDQLKEQESYLNIGFCGKFGLTEFLDNHFDVFEKKFLDERDRVQSLVGAFILSLLNGQLLFAQKIWGICEPLELRKNLIEDNNFRAVAISKTSSNQEVRLFIQQCVADLSLTDKIPTFTDDELFPFYAHANNREGLLACWKIPRSGQAYLALLTNNKYEVFSDIADEFWFSTRETIVKCLIALSKSKEVVVPHEVWKEYFYIAVYKSPLSTVKLLWQATEEDELRKELLNDALLKGCNDFHIPVMKFLIEQAESFPDNPIALDNLEYIKHYAYEQAKYNLTRLEELLSNTPMTRNIQLTKL